MLLLYENVIDIIMTIMLSDRWKDVGIELFIYLDRYIEYTYILPPIYIYVVTYRDFL